MKNGFVRVVLLSTATYLIPAAPVALLIPTAAHAQTVCTTNLLGVVTCLDGVTTTATGTVVGGTTLVGGPGLNVGSISDLTVNLTGNITTSGNNQPAVLLSTTDT